MLPTVRRFISNSNNRLTLPTDRISHASSIEDENNVYTQTLLYIVHVDEIDLTADRAHDEQPLNKLSRRVSKRTTASFNERQRNEGVQTPKVPPSTPPSFSFSNPFRRLNNLLKFAQSPSTPNINVTPLSASTAKKSSLFNRSRSQPQNNNELAFPPPPEFFYDNPILRANGPGLTDGFVDDHCHFDLKAPDADLQKLVIAVDGPSKAEIQIEVIESGLYRIYYRCQSPGSYHLSMTYNGVQIDKSPYHIILHASLPQEQVVPLPDTPIRAIIEPMEFYVNTACVVSVRPERPCAVFQAFLQAPQGNMNLPIIVHKSSKSGQYSHPQNLQCYEIYFRPHTCGNYWLNINLNHVPIIDNPCRLIIQSSSSMKSLGSSMEALFHAYTGELSQFFVSKSPDDRSVGPGRFSVNINGPSTVYLDANETEFGYEFHYKPTRNGKYLMTIKIGGKHLQGSPFPFRVYDKLNESRTTSCNTLIASQSKLNHANSYVDLDTLRSSMTGDASQVCVFGTGLYEAKKRRKTTFKIDASQAGPGLLLVGLYSPLGPCERLVIKRIMPSSSGFIYKVSYQVRARGQYILTILYGMNMQHVPGSPYLVLVE